MVLVDRGRAGEHGDALLGTRRITDGTSKTGSGMIVAPFMQAAGCPP